MMDPEDFRSTIIAAEHLYGCTCPHCRTWWLSVGPEDDLHFGPFGDDLWPEYAERHDKTVEKAKVWVQKGFDGPDEDWYEPSPEEEPRYTTQGGGICAWDALNKRFYWVKKPDLLESSSDWVQEEWGIQPL